MRRAGRILRAGCEHHPRGGHCLLLFRRNRPCRVYRGGVSDSRAGPGINGSGASRTAAGADKRSAPACFPKKGISQPAAAKADKQPPAFPCKQGTNEARSSTKKAERRNYAGAAVENIKEAVFCGKIGDFYPDMERAPTTADFCLVYRTAACSAEKAFNSDALWIKPSEYRRKTDLQGKLSPSRETRNAPFSALTMHRRHHDNKSIICNIPCPQKEAVCRLRSKSDGKKGRRLCSGKQGLRPFCVQTGDLRNQRSEQAVAQLGEHLLFRLGQVAREQQRGHINLLGGQRAGRFLFAVRKAVQQRFDIAVFQIDD